MGSCSPRAPTTHGPCRSCDTPTGTFRFELDEHGDLIDAENDPPELSAAELGAFVEFALEHARNALTEQLTTSQFRNSWPK